MSDHPHATSAILISNSGDAEVAIDLTTPATYAQETGFESSITIRGVHWDGEHRHPLTGSVEALWLRREDLAGLLSHIAAWTNQPLDRLIPNLLDGSFELAQLPGQSFTVTFGSRPDTIARLNPVVSITIVACAFRCQFHFVTDQSCLVFFARELSDLLGE